MKIIKKTPENQITMKVLRNIMNKKTIKNRETKVKKTIAFISLTIGYNSKDVKNKFMIKVKNQINNNKIKKYMNFIKINRVKISLVTKNRKINLKVNNKRIKTRVRIKETIVI